MRWRTIGKWALFSLMLFGVFSNAIHMITGAIDENYAKAMFFFVCTFVCTISATVIAQGSGDDA